MRDAYDLLELLEDEFPVTEDNTHRIVIDKETGALEVRVWLQDDHEYFPYWVEHFDLGRTPGEIFTEIKFYVGE